MPLVAWASDRVRFLLALGAIASAVVAQSYGTLPSQMLSITSTTGGVSIPHDASQVPTTGFTIEAWFYYDQGAVGGGSAPTIVRKPEDFPSYLLRMTNPTNAAPEFYCNVNNNLVIITGATLPVTPAWRHLAGTYDGAVVRLFLDGVQIASQNAVGTLTSLTGPMVLGRGNPNGGETWRGSIDGVRLWSTARSAAQIAAESRIRLTSAAGLVSAWYFDGGFDDVVAGNDPAVTPGVALATSTSPVQMAVLSAPSVVSVGSTALYTCSTVFPAVPYVFDVGLSGSAPGFVLPAPLIGSIPLNPPWVYLEFGPLLPFAWFSGFVGVTDAFGTATAAFTVPPLPSLVGLQLTGAMTLLDYGQPFGVLAASNPRSIALAGAPPTVGAVSPAVVPSNGGTVLTVTGSGFLPGAIVTVGGVVASGTVFVSPTTLTCIAPPRPVGVYGLTVTIPGPVSGSLPAALTYVPPLIVTSVLPSSAPVGTPVVISGSGFQAGTTAVLNGQALTFILQTATSLVFLAPAGVPCDAQLVVSDPATGLSQTRVWNAAPVVSTVVGAQGPASGGGAFTLTGTGFAYGSTVSVGGVPASIVSGAATSLSCLAPPGAVGPAVITVTTPTGCFTTAVYTYQ